MHNGSGVVVAHDYFFKLPNRPTKISVGIAPSESLYCPVVLQQAPTNDREHNDNINSINKTAKT